MMLSVIEIFQVVPKAYIIDWHSVNKMELYMYICIFLPRQLTVNKSCWYSDWLTKVGQLLS